MVVEYELFFLGVDGSSYHVVRKVDLDGISGSILLCVNYLGIDLSCCYLFMAKHFADCIDVCAIGKLQCGIGMAETVEIKSKSIRKQICAGKTQPVENKRFFIILPYR